MAQTQHETYIPRIYGAIERARLLDKLQLAIDHKLTLICAPPGYGKTTTAAQFAQQSRHRVVWHTVEEQERDFPTFYVQCVAAFKQVLPKVQPLATSTHHEPTEFAADLSNFLRTALRDDLFYVLDDVHHLIGSAPGELWLQTFVSLIPSRCHVILISRTLPTLPLTEMIARREVLAIGQEELRFTDEEIAVLARDVRAAPPANQSEVIQRLEGWPAGINLALQPFPLELERLLLSGGEGPEALFESLASLMLSVQPPGLRNFLLASSTLPRLTPELAINVLGLSNAADWIAEALKRNLFLSRVPNGLTYHKLFRSFLQRQLQQINPGYFYELHLRAGHWFEKHDRIDEAFDHFLAAGAADSAASIIERVIHAYFAQGKVETLLKWADDLSEAGVWSPKLLYAAATIQIDRLNYEAATTALDQAEVIFAEMGDQAYLAEIQLQRARINLQNGHYLAAVALAEKQLNLPFDETNLHGRALRVIGTAHFRLGRADLAVRFLEEALPLSRARADKLALSNLLQDLDMVYLRLGQLEEASACLQEVVALRRSLGNSSLLAQALNNLGYHYHQHGDYQQALLTFHEGLSVVARIHSKRAESYLLWSMGDLQRDCGSFEEAWRLYSRALEFAGSREPNLRCSILISAAILRRWQQKWDEALGLAEEAFTLAEAHKLVIESIMAQAICWALRAEQGEIAPAFDSLVELIEDLKKRRASNEIGQLSAICAHLSLLRFDKSAADQYLKSAVQQSGSLQPLIAEVMYSTPLESFVSGNASKYPAIFQGLNRLRGSQSKQAQVIQLTDKIRSENIYSLRIQTLGKEKIERDGVPVLPAEWRAAAARELFFYLLFLGAKRREIISLEFWPDSSPDRVRSNFHTTLYRVRQALGENVIVFRDEQYTINPDLDIWCDTHEFEMLAQHAQDLPLRDARTEDSFRRAVDLYQGDFLPLLDAEWIISYREKLNETYLDSLIGLGQCSQVRRDFKQALNIFRQVLKIDPFREDVHCAVMLCYAEQGQKQKIFTHLKDLQKLLWDELGTEPDKETLNLAKSLLS